ncbi:MAG TPA: histidine phosphatase family protein, partial [Acidimicrobiales bacterium]|nr:histidine phosphatase family protein [Acidimicrobiales bacterium]
MTGASAREVWVLRHAKAVPHRSDDHERALTERGKRQCAEVAAHLVDIGCASDVPATVLVSSATRARETAELVLCGLDSRVEVEVRDALYRADADDVIEMLREVGADVPSVMVV